MEKKKQIAEVLRQTLVEQCAQKKAFDVDKFISQVSERSSKIETFSAQSDTGCKQKT